jgi:hypothetical protein
MRLWPVGRDDITSPFELQRMYARGYAGAYRDPEAAERLHGSFGSKQTFGDWTAVQSGLAGAGEGQLAMLYRYLYHLAPKTYLTAQRRGDCVSFAYRLATDTIRATEILAEGQAEGWVNETSPEWLYWGRGHSGEGASCSSVGEFVSVKAGMLLRGNYPEWGFDVTKYDPRVGLDGRSGPPRAAVEATHTNNIAVLTRITSIEEARDAIAAGHALVCCSGCSWSDKRDDRGVSERTNVGWAHAMCWSAVDARPEIVSRYGGPLFGIHQTWGNWNSGGWAPEYGPCPTGMFWTRAKDAAVAISHGGTYAVADARGFRPTILPSLGAGGRI